jgi:gamma-glutamylcysteine synthetase
MNIAETGRTPAEDLLELYSGRWQADAQQVFREFAY